MNNLHALPPSQVENRFEEMIPYLKNLMNKFPEGTYTLGGILGKFIRQEWTCWIVTYKPEQESTIQAVIASAAYPDMAGVPVLQIVFVTGANPNMLIDTLDEFHAQAFARGIRKIEIIGRAGWTPGLKELGYNTDLRLYRKQLTEEIMFIQTEGTA